jgi:hypothetical protein
MKFNKKKNDKNLAVCSFIIIIITITLTHSFTYLLSPSLSLFSSIIYDKQASKKANKKRVIAHAIEIINWLSK